VVPEICVPIERQIDRETDRQTDRHAHTILRSYGELSAAKRDGGPILKRDQVDKAIYVISHKCSSSVLSSMISRCQSDCERSKIRVVARNPKHTAHFSLQSKQQATAIGGGEEGRVPTTSEFSHRICEKKSHRSL